MHLDAFVFVRLDHVASVIVNGITASCERLRCFAVVESRY